MSAPGRARARRRELRDGAQTSWRRTSRVGEGRGSCQNVAMSGLTTIEAPQVIARPGDPELDEGEPSVAHIVKVEPGESATAKVLEARVAGTPLEALCGHVWVPSRDPRNLPMCSRCKEIYEVYRFVNRDLGETPSD